MKRLSTGVLTSLIIASLGLTAVAAPSGHASPGNIGTNVIAQATPAASPAASTAPAATPMASPASAATPMASAAPAAPAGGTATSPPANVPPMQFGSPPSGEIPILFNDHHVYSKPDVLKQGRVLAALVRGGTILVPLRSMFEQMGATVSYDPGSKTVDVTKPGSDVKVTLGKPEVTINGESRPLDVPPMMYHGQILVPVRVISEGMGAYVQWVPDKRLVVVRYLPPTPPPPPAPPPVTAPTTAPTPAPAPKKVTNEVFLAGDYLLGPKVYNEFDPGVKQPNDSSYAVRGAAEFNLFDLPWMVEGEYRQFGYQHNATVTPAGGPNTPCNAVTVPAGEPGCVTIIGGNGQVWVAPFSPRDQDVDGRLGIKVLDPRVYLGVSYLARSGNYGYPRQSGVGFGLEKLPDLDHPFSVYGSAYYYPQVKGTCDTGTCPTGPFDLEYRIFRYEIGATYSIQGTPLYIEGGWLGDEGKNKLNAPSDFTHNAGYVGIGIHF